MFESQPQTQSDPPAFPSVNSKEKITPPMGAEKEAATSLAAAQPRRVSYFSARQYRPNKDMAVEAAVKNCSFWGTCFLSPCLRYPFLDPLSIPNYQNQPISQRYNVWNGQTHSPSANHKKENTADENYDRLSNKAFKKQQNPPIQPNLDLL